MYLAGSGPVRPEAAVVRLVPDFPGLDLAGPAGCEETDEVRVVGRVLRRGLLVRGARRPARRLADQHQNVLARCARHVDRSVVVAQHPAVVAVVGGLGRAPLDVQADPARADVLQRGSRRVLFGLRGSPGQVGRGARLDSLGKGGSGERRDRENGDDRDEPGQATAGRAVVFEEPLHGCGGVGGHHNPLPSGARLPSS